ncbi:MAG: GNAT family N-acetyltransferase [Acidimicrobiales bacterium]|nr:GNAT family N-acetyltransferase [Acidimicrobiales bacterium]
MELELQPVSPADAARIWELVHRSEAHDRVPRVLSRHEVDEELAEAHFDPETDARLAIAGGEVVGWGRVWHRPSGEELERAYLFGTVAPEHRGTGVGSALMTWLVARGTEQLVAGPEHLPAYLRVDAYEWQADALRLYSRFGFTPVRWFEELLRTLEAPPSAPVPDGVDLVPWDRALDEEVRLAKNAAFSDHWGSTPTDADSWRQWVEGYGTRLDLSFVALAGGRVVGHSLNSHYPEDETLLGRRDGWIDNLGTVREWRGRGVASALIAASLRAFAGAGFTHAAIGVDADNPNGAAQLYRSLGFRPLHRSITHQREVTSGRAGPRTDAPRTP